MHQNEKIFYRNKSGQVIWYGVQFERGDEFKNFLFQDVHSRLEDEELDSGLEAIAQGAVEINYSKEKFNKFLDNKPSQTRLWVFGEALAEAYLQINYKIEWPWNTKRDVRTRDSSLPGPDLIGFIENKNGTNFVFGEVKTSGENAKPPSVMRGPSGLIGQIINLVNDQTDYYYLVTWLWPRCKGTKFEDSFNSAFSSFLNSDNQLVTLFGILIRDTSPDEADLKSGGEKLANLLQSPTECNLVAIYLPCTLSELPGLVYGDSS